MIYDSEPPHVRKVTLVWCHMDYESAIVRIAVHHEECSKRLGDMEMLSLLISRLE